MNSPRVVMTSELSRDGAVAPLAAKPQRAPHVIDYRISIALFGRRYYFAFFGGHEQRSLGRLVAESQRKSWLHTTFSLSAVMMFSSTMLMSAMATAYLVKSLLGIDVFDDHLFLHHLFFNP